MGLMEKAIDELADVVDRMREPYSDAHLSTLASWARNRADGVEWFAKELELYAEDGER